MSTSVVSTRIFARGVGVARLASCLARGSIETLASEGGPSAAHTNVTIEARMALIRNNLRWDSGIVVPSFFLKSIIAFFVV
jgi:hypothetical protein